MARCATLAKPSVLCGCCGLCVPRCPAVDRVGDLVGDCGRSWHRACRDRVGDMRRSRRSVFDGVQAVVVPGLGVAACQAGVDNTHQNQMLVFRELQKGTEPNAIIELLSADPAFQMRQFGILDVQGPLTTTSSSCSRSTRCSTFPRWAPRRRPCAPRSSPRWRDTSAEKPRTSASSSAGQAEAA